MPRADLLLTIPLLDAGSAGCDTRDDTAASFSAASCTAPLTPRGTEPGSILPNVSLLDCDGRPVQTDSLCGYPVRLFHDYCGWWAPESDTLYVVTESPDGQRGQHVAARGVKVPWQAFLQPILQQLTDGQIEVDVPLTADEVAAPFCHDLFSTVGAYVTGQDYGVIFDGEQAVSARGVKDFHYAHVLKQYLAPCADKLDLEGLGDHSCDGATMTTAQRARPGCTDGTCP